MNFKLNAKALRKIEPETVVGQKPNLVTQEIYIVLDNVLDTYNIGSVFRLADAVAAKKVYLCGGTATPPNNRIFKASINTTEWVDWQYFSTAKEAIEDLRAKVPGVQVVAIEQDEHSMPYDQYEFKLPTALVVGNETTGVSQEALDLCDQVIELPMFGVNISLNVMVSLGIVLYQVIEKTQGNIVLTE